MHLHLGIKAEGLPADLDCHHLIVNNWHDVTESQSVNIVSIPTVFDPTLAPEGRHVVHAYYAASEPYEVWEGVQRGSQRYKEMKREHSETLWKVGRSWEARGGGGGCLLPACYLPPAASCFHPCPCISC